jgi:REP element-mobilizing transposase RayT
MVSPIAYLITFTTYGTWLHGDTRGSVGKENNQYGSAYMESSPALYRKEQRNLKNQPVTLSSKQRDIVLQAILKVCKYKGWFAHAVHVRSNHAHIVVSGEKKPEEMMVSFKTYATRALRNNKNTSKRTIKYWTRHGSTKYLWTKKSLANAIMYVKNEQGRIMAFGVTSKTESIM